MNLQFKPPGFSGRAGMARADITPAVGIYARNWGAAAHDTAEGIHRPLFISALVIQDSKEGKPLVIVDADLGWWRSLELERSFRDTILKACNLDESRFIFALTHTHASPPLTDQVDEEWQGGDLLLPFLDQVRNRAIEVVQLAMQSVQTVTIEWRAGKCQLATARDLCDPDPSRDNRRICGFDPDAEADDTLLVGRVSNDDGKTLAIIANYACHPTTLAWDNRLISPDFIGAMRETIEKEQTDTLAFFLQGASGELSPRYQYVGDPAVADGHGKELGYAILSTLSGMEPAGQQLTFAGVCESGAPLAIWKRESGSPSTELKSLQTTVDLPLKNWPSAEELERQMLAATERQTQERLRRKRDIRRSLGDGDTYSLPIWIWKIGDAFLIANMLESYSWIQQELRKEFPDSPVIYLNLANGSMGYLPLAELYDEDVYQVWQTPFAAGSLEKLKAGICQELQDL
ncbi:MAG: neutral/alkaline non-lysosomal ceramidase N-terminal domain-containing protein [Verrucomicrobiota bacterium]